MEREGSGKGRKMLALGEEEKLGEGRPVRSVGKIRPEAEKNDTRRLDEIIVFLMINIIIMLFLN